jgi:hypothetical protein
MSKQMKEQEELVQANVSMDPAAADEFEAPSDAHAMQGFLTELKVHFKEMLSEGIGSLAESMEENNDNLRSELSENITIAATEQHLLMTSLHKQLQGVVKRQRTS